MPDDAVNSPDTTITAVSKDIRLPVFCPTDAPTWFRRAEVQFRLKNITNDARKADFVLAALPDDVFSSLAEFLDALGDSPALYSSLKDHLLKEFVPSPEERSERLIHLTKQPLGDQRPSTAFREMKSLTRLPPDTTGAVKSLDLLRILWLLRLPEAVRAGITNFNDVSESDLLKQADALQSSTKAASRRPIFAATDCDHALQDSNPEAPTDGNSLTAAAYQKSRLASRGSPSFQRPQKFNNFQPSRSFAPKKADLNLDYCYFHLKLCHGARKCRQPCSWPKNL